MNKKNFINEFKKLKDIKADDSLKFKLYEKITKKIGKNFLIKSETDHLLNYKANLNIKQISTFQKILFIHKLLIKKNIFIPILLIIALMGSSAGATYASQSSLPGEILYPIKIALEKVQESLIINDAKKTDLYLKFSSKRLEEIEKLADEQMADEQIIKSVVINYQNELAKSNNILILNENNQEKTAEIAKKIADSTFKNKLTLTKISGKIKNRNALNAIKNALEKASEHNDIATLILLENATSTVKVANSNIPINTLTDEAENYGLQIRVLNKISEANHKIVEAEKYLAKKEAKGNNVSAAKEQINNAKVILGEAENLLIQKNFIEAFLKAKEAHKTAQIAKKSAENKNNEENEGENNKQDNQKEANEE